MGSDWEEIPFNDLGEVNRGRSRHRPRYAEHLYGGQYPFIQTGDIRGSNGRVIKHTQTYSEAGLAQSRLWPTGTMCITIAANIAETAILTYPACFPDSVVGFIADESKCDVRFIEYNFRLLKRRLQSEAIGSVQDNINLATLSRLNIPLPSLPEQKAIAHILGSLDDKIELNRQMNETLESMAQALFKSWFVDFDPVIDNALAEGNTIPDVFAERAEQRRKPSPPAPLPEVEGSKNNPPLPSGEGLGVRELFPSEFEYTEEMGWIPKGWSIVDLENATKTIIDHRGKTPKKLGTDWKEFGYPAISAKNIKNGKLVRKDTIRFTDQELYEKWMSVELQKGDVLMTSEAPLGEKLFLAKHYKWVLSQRLFALRAAETISGIYLYHWLNTTTAKADIDGRASGTTVQGIRQSELRKVSVLIPSKECISFYSQWTAPLMEKKDANEESIEGLTKLRDTLLPKLLSGELRIPDAEKLIAEAQE